MDGWFRPLISSETENSLQLPTLTTTSFWILLGQMEKMVLYAIPHPLNPLYESTNHLRHIYRKILWMQEYFILG